MDGELSTGIRVMIVLVLMSVIIAVVVGITYYLTKEVEGSEEEFTGASTSFSESTFNKYNETFVTGAEVQAAVEMYSTSTLTIVVAKQVGGVLSHYCYGEGLNNLSDFMSGAKLTANVDAGSCPVSGTSTGFFAGQDLIKMRDNTLPSYVRSTQKYESRLIRDTGGTTVGILFVASM